MGSDAWVAVWGGGGGGDIGEADEPNLEECKGDNAPGEGLGV